MAKKKISLVKRNMIIAIVLFALSVIGVGIVFAASLYTLAKFQANAITLEASSTFSYASSESTITFTKPGDTQNITIKTTNSTASVLELSYSLRVADAGTEGDAATLSKAILVYITKNATVSGSTITSKYKKEYFGTLAELTASGGTDITGSYIAATGDSDGEKGTMTDVITLELHLGASDSIYEGKSLTLTTTATTTNADYYNNIFVSTSAELDEAIDDINSVFLVSNDTKIVLMNDIGYTGERTVKAACNIDLNGYNLTLSTAEGSTTSGSLTIDGASAYIWFTGNGTAPTVTIGDSYASTTIKEKLISAAKKALADGVTAGGDGVDLFGNNKFYLSEDTSLTVSEVNDLNSTSTDKANYTYSGVTLESTTNIYTGGKVKANDITRSSVEKISVLGEEIEFQVFDSAHDLVDKYLRNVPKASTGTNTETKEKEEVLENVFYDIYLPTSITSEGATIEWTSSNPDVMDNSGHIVNTDADSDVTLYAAITVNGVTHTEEFKFHVVISTTEINFYKFIANLSPIIIYEQGFPTYDDTKTTITGGTGLYILPQATDADDDYFYMNSYETPSTSTQSQYWTYPGHDFIYLEKLTYSDVTDSDGNKVYDYISVANYADGKGSEQCVYQSSATTQTYAKIKVTGTFNVNGRTFESSSEIVVVISSGTDTTIYDEAFEDIEQKLVKVNVLKNILKTRVASGMANENGDFYVPSTYGTASGYKFNITYAIADTDDGVVKAISSGTYDCYYDENTSTYNLADDNTAEADKVKCYKVQLNLNNLPSTEEDVPLSVTIQIQGGAIESKTQTLNFIVPAAVHASDVGYNASLFNSIKYQVYEQLPSDERTNTTENSTYSTGFSVDSSGYMTNITGDYILLRDIVGDKEYLTAANAYTILKTYTGEKPSETWKLNTANQASWYIEENSSYYYSGLTDTTYGGCTELWFYTLNSTEATTYSSNTDSTARDFAALINWATGTSTAAASTVVTNTSNLGSNTATVSDGKEYLTDDEIAVLKTYYMKATGASSGDWEAEWKNVAERADGYVMTDGSAVETLAGSLISDDTVYFTYTGVMEWATNFKDNTVNTHERDPSYTTGISGNPDKYLYNLVFSTDKNAPESTIYVKWASLNSEDEGSGVSDAEQSYTAYTYIATIGGVKWYYNTSIYGDGATRYNIKGYSSTGKITATTKSDGTGTKIIIESMDGTENGIIPNYLDDDTSYITPAEAEVIFSFILTQTNVEGFKSYVKTFYKSALIPTYFTDEGVQLLMENFYEKSGIAVSTTTTTTATPNTTTTNNTSDKEVDDSTTTSYTVTTSTDTTGRVTTIVATTTAVTYDSSTKEIKKTTTTTTTNITDYFKSAATTASALLTTGSGYSDGTTNYTSGGTITLGTSYTTDSNSSAYYIPAVANLDSLSSALQYFTELKVLYIKGTSDLPAFLSEYGLTTALSRARARAVEEQTDGTDKNIIETLVLEHVADNYVSFSLSNIKNFDSLKQVDVSDNAGVTNVNPLVNYLSDSYTYVDLSNTSVTEEFYQYAKNNLGGANSGIYYGYNERLRTSGNNAGTISLPSELSDLIAENMYLTTAVTNSESETIYWRIESGNKITYVTSAIDSTDVEEIETADEMQSLLSPYYYVTSAVTIGTETYAAGTVLQFSYSSDGSYSVAGTVLTDVSNGSEDLTAPTEEDIVTTTTYGDAENETTESSTEVAETVAATATGNSSSNDGTGSATNDPANKTETIYYQKKNDDGTTEDVPVSVTFICYRFFYNNNGNTYANTYLYCDEKNKTLKAGTKKYINSKLPATRICFIETENDKTNLEIYLTCKESNGKKYITSSSYTESVTSLSIGQQYNSSTTAKTNIGVYFPEAKQYLSTVTNKTCTTAEIAADTISKSLICNLDFDQAVASDDNREFKVHIGINSLYIKIPEGNSDFKDEANITASSSGRWCYAYTDGIASELTVTYGTDNKTATCGAYEFGVEITKTTTSFKKTITETINSVDDSLKYYWNGTAEEVIQRTYSLVNAGAERAGTATYNSYTYSYRFWYKPTSESDKIYTFEDSSDQEIEQSTITKIEDEGGNTITVASSKITVTVSNSNIATITVSTDSDNVQTIAYTNSVDSTNTTTTTYTDSTSDSPTATVWTAVNGTTYEDTTDDEGNVTKTATERVEAEWETYKTNANTWTYNASDDKTYISYVTGVTSDTIASEVAKKTKYIGGYVRYTGTDITDTTATTRTATYYVESTEASTSTYTKDQVYEMNVLSDGVLSWTKYEGTVASGKAESMNGILETANTHFDDLHYGEYYGMYYAYGGTTATVAAHTYTYDSDDDTDDKSVAIAEYTYTKSTIYRIMPNEDNSAFVFVKASPTTTTGYYYCTENFTYGSYNFAEGSVYEITFDGNGDVESVSIATDGTDELKNVVTTYSEEVEQTGTDGGYTESTSTSDVESTTRSANNLTYNCFILRGYTTSSTKYRMFASGSTSTVIKAIKNDVTYSSNGWSTSDPCKVSFITAAEYEQVTNGNFNNTAIGALSSELICSTLSGSATDGWNISWGDVTPTKYYLYFPRLWRFAGTTTNSSVSGAQLSTSFTLTGTPTAYYICRYNYGTDENPTYAYMFYSADTETKDLTVTSSSPLMLGWQTPSKTTDATSSCKGVYCITTESAFNEYSAWTMDDYCLYSPTDKTKQDQSSSIKTFEVSVTISEDTNETLENVAEIIYTSTGKTTASYTKTLYAYEESGGTVYSLTYSYTKESASIKNTTITYVDGSGNVETLTNISSVNFDTENFEKEAIISSVIAADEQSDIESSGSGTFYDQTYTSTNIMNCLRNNSWTIGDKTYSNAQMVGKIFRLKSGGYRADQYVKVGGFYTVYHDEEQGTYSLKAIAEIDYIYNSTVTTTTSTEVTTATTTTENDTSVNTTVVTTTYSNGDETLRTVTETTVVTKVYDETTGKTATTTTVTVEENDGGGTYTTRKTSTNNGTADGNKRDTETKKTTITDSEVNIPFARLINMRKLTVLTENYNWKGPNGDNAHTGTGGSYTVVVTAFTHEKTSNTDSDGLYTYTDSERKYQIEVVG